MKPFPTRSSALATLGLCALPLSVGAAGLGELIVLSQIGDPLRAEIAMITTAEERLEASCFSLNSASDDSLPGIGKARLRLKKLRQQWQLQVLGNTPLNEPLATLGVHMGCGLELQRDYIVMPLPPGEKNTLDTSRRRSTDTPVRPATALDSESPEAAAASPSTATITGENKRRSRKKPEPTTPPQTDRLVLSSSTMLKENPAPPAAGDVEIRMLRLETSLEQLENSLKNLDTALALSAESVALRRELQLADTLEPATPSVAPPDKNNAHQSWRQWLELILGTVLGGVLTASLLQWLNSRSTRLPPARLPQTGLSRSTKSQRKPKRVLK